MFSLISFAVNTLDAQVQIIGADFPLFVAAIITGFFATVLMTITIMFIRVVGNVHMSIPLMFGSMMFPRIGDIWQRRIGMTMHLIIGSFFGFVFGLLIQKELLFNLSGLSGATFGLILWVIMMVVMLPIAGYGFFGLAKDRRIWIAALVGHLIYGVSFVFLFPLIFLN